MCAWSEKPPSTEDILGNISLYWLTRCFPTCIWIYREVRQHTILADAELTCRFLLVCRTWVLKPGPCM